LEPINTKRSLFAMPAISVATAEYHHRQARTFIMLANSTSDPEITTRLINLAAKHTALAQEAERNPLFKPDHDILH
jgi:hypothetical protein